MSLVVPVSVVPLEVRTDQLTTFEGPLHWSRPWTFTPSKETSTEMPEVGVRVVVDELLGRLELEGELRLGVLEAGHRRTPRATSTTAG